VRTLPEMETFRRIDNSTRKTSEGEKEE
jgi:hypothetical protein